MINEVTLIGRLGKDPEVRHFDNESKVCNFSVATDDSYKDKEGKKVEQTDWHNIAIWRPGLIDIAEKYLKKGSLVRIRGKIKTRTWQAENGETRYATEILVESFKMLGNKGDSNSSQGPPPASANDAPPQQTSNANPGGQEIEDDLPF